MPFTFSHPAMVLPLSSLPKKWFSTTGLVVGSLTPDFEYFLRMNLESKYSHTIHGLFWFDLPLGLLLAFVFHTIVRNPLFDNLPKFLKWRFSRFTQFRWNEHFRKHWPAVVTSIVIGAASHVFWDSFTHKGAYFVERIPMLASSVNLFGAQIPVLKIVQHASTLVGAFVIIWVVYRLPQQRPGRDSVSRNYWAICAALAVLVLMTRFAFGLEISAFGNVIASGISAMMISLIVASFLCMHRRTSNES